MMTPWVSAGQYPHLPGWYDVRRWSVQFRWWNRDERCWWDGRCWLAFAGGAEILVGSHDRDQWRGSGQP